MTGTARTRTKPRTPMTADERTLARALNPNNLRMPAGSPAKSFLRKMAHFATIPEATITWAQSEALVSNAIRYRKQLPADVVSLAQRLAKAGPWRDGDRWGMR